MELRKCPRCGKYMISSITPNYNLTWVIQYNCSCGYTEPDYQIYTSTTTAGEQNGLYGKQK